MRVDPAVLSPAVFLAIIASTGCRSDASAPSVWRAGTLSITLGPPEIVFHWATDRCEDLDIPDGPAHPVRLSDGSLLLVDGDAPRNYVSTGADFNSLKRNCTPVLIAADSTTPNSYQNQEWIYSAYRVGAVLHALIHNEYHDPVAQNCQPGNSHPGNPCWYNSITYATSSDGGRTFIRPSPPAHVVAPAPLAWDPMATNANAQPQGYFEPSNIILRDDGYYYAVFFTIPSSVTLTNGLCVMRTTTLDDPSSWRAWDGSGYHLRMASPYVTGSTTPACTVLFPGYLHGSLTYDSYLKRYLLVGMTNRPVNGQMVCGFFYTTSADLVTWDSLVPFKAGYLPWDACRPPDGTNTGVDVYPSIVDHDDPTSNFERPGQTPYLYYTHQNNNGLDRDLVRRRMMIVAP